MNTPITIKQPSLNGIPIHPSLTAKRISRAIVRQMSTLANPGFCIRCGRAQQGCEPDAREYTCNRCGTPTVYGAAELGMELF